MRKLLVLAFAAVLTACHEAPREVVETKSVVLTTPVRIDESATRHYPAVVSEAHTLNLSFKVAGRIARLYVKEGDHVRCGQLLATLDAEDYRLALESVQTQYDQTRRDVERLAQLHEQRAVSQSDYEKAVSGLRQLAIQLKSAQNQLADTRLYAPCDGSVERLNFSASEMVGAGTSVLTLLDVTTLEVVANILAADYLQRDRVVDFHCAIDGVAKDVPLRLISYSPKADAAQLYELRLAFVGSHGQQLTAGMNVEVSVNMAGQQKREATATYAIPLTAIFEDAKGNSCVWVVAADHTASARKVTVCGTDTEGRTVVVSGLRGTERVVRSGVSALHEGARVNEVEEHNDTNVGGLL